ncbi:MAG: hypothetical protein JWM88_721 [Verrucomicrobia bacterium]|nr:hypothetical protein [Verrucomicrobiota bacterium]
MKFLPFLSAVVFLEVLAFFAARFLEAADLLALGFALGVALWTFFQYRRPRGRSLTPGKMSAPRSLGVSVGKAA